MHNYFIQAVQFHYHNFCKVCALRVQFVSIEVAERETSLKAKMVQGSALTLIEVGILGVGLAV